MVDRLTWTLTRDGRPVHVGEDGSIDGDADLVAEVRSLLARPVRVARRGTVPSPGTPDDELLELRPGDGRHIAAAVRLLCREESPQPWRIVEAWFR